MKNAGKACNNRLYRHIRTFEKIVKNYFVIYLKSTSPSVLYSFHKVDAGLRLYRIQHRSDRFATVFLQFCKNWNMSQKQDAFVSIVPRRKTGFLPNTGKNGNRSPWGE